MCHIAVFGMYLSFRGDEPTMSLFADKLFQFYVTAWCSDKFIYSLRASAKRERVFAEYENFLQYERPDPTDPTDPTDRHAFQWLITFEPCFQLQNGLRHWKAAFNKSLTFKWRL